MFVISYTAIQALTLAASEGVGQAAAAAAYDEEKKEREVLAAAMQVLQSVAGSEVKAVTECTGDWSTPNAELNEEERQEAKIHEEERVNATDDACASASAHDNVDDDLGDLQARKHSE